MARTMGETIKELRKAKGYTQEELGDLLGVKKAAVNKWETGAVENIKRSVIANMAKIFSVSPTYLMCLEEEDVKLTAAVRIPVYGRIPAGIPLEAIADILDWEEISPDMTADGSEYLALKVTGDSMYPKYLDGDVVIVRIQPECESGQDAVVYVNGYEATLKKVLKKEDCIVLQPVNPDYEPLIYDYDDKSNPVTVLGVVKELRRKV
jgi:repressor LexA